MLGRGDQPGQEGGGRAVAVGARLFVQAGGFIRRVLDPTGSLTFDLPT